MLVNLNQVLEMAEKGNYAVGAFNAPSLDIARAIIKGAEEMNMPVILSHAEGHGEIVPIDVIGPILVNLAEKARVPVAVHLDHSTSFDVIKEAIDLGFTSVMIDASAKSFEENKAISKEVVDYAKAKNVSVEAELGTMVTTDVAIKETEEDAGENIYTDPAQAKEFVDYTGIDALAASFGTAHGIYISEPKLDFNRLADIRGNISVPVVMHGGSGLADSDYKNAIDNGVRKINYFSYLAKFGADAMREYLSENDNVFYTDAAEAGMEAMVADVKRVIGIFSNK